MATKTNNYWEATRVQLLKMHCIISPISNVLKKQHNTSYARCHRILLYVFKINYYNFCKKKKQKIVLSPSTFCQVSSQKQEAYLFSLHWYCMLLYVFCLWSEQCWVYTWVNNLLSYQLIQHVLSPVNFSFCAAYWWRNQNRAFPF